MDKTNDIITTKQLNKLSHKTDSSTLFQTMRFYPDSFTGKERDKETGYGYFGARYMDYELMTMWLSVDPMSDKYPSISPYNYCAWNPLKLVDPDGNEAIGNDDWYKNKKGEVRWFNSTDNTYTHEGEEYQRLGKTAYMTNSSGEFVYGDQFGHTHESAPLKEVSITEHLTDHERTMNNPLVQSIHQSAADFWGHPVTGAVVDAILFVVSGGTEAVVKDVGKAFLKHKAKSLSVSQSSSNVSTTAGHIREWLGEGRCKINKYGDPIFTSKDNLRKFRIDMNNTQGDKIHMHLERKTPNGNWKDATPTHRFYPKQ